MTRKGLSFGNSEQTGSKPKQRKFSKGKVLFWSAAIAATVAIGSFVYSGMPRTVTTTVKGLTEKTADGGDQKYLVQTTSGVFENTDWLFFKTTSSDYQNELVGKEGYKVELSVWGWRWGWKGWYENIHDIKVIGPDEAYMSKSKLEGVLDNLNFMELKTPVNVTPDLVQKIADYDKQHLDVGIVPVIKDGQFTRVGTYDAQPDAYAQRHLQTIVEFLEK
jgi:hypothetical protein